MNISRYKSKFISANFLLFGLTLCILRLPSLFFSWWYADENIYLAIGHSIVKGQLLYVNVWDNKPPLIYLIYAGIYQLFNTQTYAYKLFNLLLGLWELCIFYLIVKEVFQFSKKQKFWTTFSLSVLLGIAFEATSLNAENIFVPLVLSGFYLVYSELLKFENTGRIKSYKLLISGVLWLLASLTKIHALAEILIVLFIVGVILISNKFSLNEHQRSFFPQAFYLKELWFFLILPLLPIVIGYAGLIIFYGFQGYLSELFYALIGFSKDYVQPKNIPIILGFKLDKLMTGLQLRTILLFINLCICTYLFWKKQIQKNSFIIWCWLSTVIFLVLVPETDYGHYLLQLLPPAIIFLSSVINHYLSNKKSITDKLLVIFSIGLGTQMLLSNFPTTLNSLWNGYDLVLKYFGNFIQVSIGRKSLAAWQRNFNPSTYDYQQLLPSQIKILTTPKDKIFLFGDLFDVYAMSNRLSGSKWVVGYHLSNFSVDLKKLYQEILSNKTKLIVIDTTRDSDKKFTSLVSSHYKNILNIQNYAFWISDR